MLFVFKQANVSFFQIHITRSCQGHEKQDNGQRFDKSIVKVKSGNTFQQIANVGIRKVGFSEVVKHLPVPVGKWAITYAIKSTKNKPGTASK